MVKFPFCLIIIFIISWPAVPFLLSFTHTLSGKDLANCEGVCKRWNQVASKKYLYVPFPFLSFCFLVLFPSFLHSSFSLNNDIENERNNKDGEKFVPMFTKMNPRSFKLQNNSIVCTYLLNLYFPFLSPNLFRVSFILLTTTTTTIITTIRKHEEEMKHKKEQDLEELRLKNKVMILLCLFIYLSIFLCVCVCVSCPPYLISLSILSQGKYKAYKFFLALVNSLAFNIWYVRSIRSLLIFFIFCVFLVPHSVYVCALYVCVSSRQLFSADFSLLHSSTYSIRWFEFHELVVGLCSL